MKTLFLFTLSIILAINLNARENPFEVTNEYEEEAAKMIELNETPMTKDGVQEAQYIEDMQQKMSKNSNENKNKVEDTVNKNMPVVNDKTTPKAYSKQEVDSLIQKTKKQNEQKTKELVKKELSKTGNSDQIVYVKPRADIIDEDALLSKQLLPFLKIEFNDNKLIIHTEHEVSKKFSVTSENKLVIDYKASINFDTKFDTLDSKNYKRIAVGNHKKENFFRIAIELIDKPSKYDVTYKDNLIVITKIN